MIKICLDATIFIDYYNPILPWQADIEKIFELSKNNKIKIYISLQTLEELKVKKDKAYELSKTIPKLPHWPIGSWDEQVGTWDDPTGSWDDGKENNKIQLNLEKLAKSGNDIRDRGAFIDSLRSKMDYFVTSDNQFVKKCPKERINNTFDTKVIGPKDLIEILNPITSQST